VTLSVSVMAHPSRADLVNDLLERIGPVPVTWDKVNDRHDPGTRAMEAHDPTCTHHLVIQDDALPCADLLAGIEKALVHVPDGHPASFYIGKVRPFRSAVTKAVARAEGASWIVMAGIYWGPAIVVPTASIVELSAWYRGKHGARHQNYDRRVSKWFERQDLGCWYSWPSLVDHRGDDSLVQGRSGVRRAHRALTPEESALDVDWSGEVVEMPHTERLDRNRQRRAVA
jgi:hypothetical protein